MKKEFLSLLAVTAVLLLAAVPVAFAGFCGENGVVRLSFSKGPELQPVATVEPGEGGVTMVDLYAWLTDVEPLEKDGQPFDGLAAFELHLAIEGAEGYILKQEFSQEAKQIGPKLGSVIVGLYPGLYFTDGAVQLVHWQIMFQGRPENVVFRVDPDQMVTCERTPGCPGTGLSALYTGIDSQGFIGSVFGAGAQRAYLNPGGETDLSLSRGTVTWRDVGEFQLRTGK